MWLKRQGGSVLGQDEKRSSGVQMKVVQCSALHSTAKQPEQQVQCSTQNDWRLDLDATHFSRSLALRSANWASYRSSSESRSSNSCMA